MTRRSKEKGKYPEASPSGKKDPYFPFTGISRPIFRDERLFPKFFNVKKKKTWLKKKQNRY